MSIVYLFTVLCFSLQVQVYGNYDFEASIRTEPSYSYHYRDGLSNNGLYSASHFHHGSSGLPGLNGMSSAELEGYFADHRWTTEQILDTPAHYMSDEYVKVAKKQPLYPAYIKKYYQKYVAYSAFQKAFGWIKGTYVAGMAQRFAALYTECLREQKIRKRREEEAQRLNQIDKEKVRYDQTLDTVERYLLKKSESVPCYRARCGALEAMRCNDTRSEKKINVSETIQYFAQAYDIMPSMLENGMMNAYEYQLHTEFIEQLSTVAKLQHFYDDAQDYRVFLDAVGYGISLGIEANNNHDAITATHWADYAWQALDIAKAIGEGVALGVYNTAMLGVQIVAHPIESFQTVVHGIRTILSFFDHVVDHIAQLDEDPFSLVNLKKNMGLLREQINTISAHCSAQLAKIPLREKVKHVTAFGTEIMAPALFFKAGKILSARMKPVIESLITFMQDEATAVEIAGAGETIVIKGAEKAHEMGGIVKEVLKDSGSLVESNAILKSGYYEVNGFKFTEHYYNRLWSSGRGFPGFRAESILRGAESVTPDPQGYPGFYKYIYDGWEMIYNPVTKIVSHMQPL